jgi:hypothetical protein
MRGGAVGGFATALAALSHTVAGGGTPSTLALVVGAVFGGMLGTFALSAHPSLVRLAIAVGGTQLAFHVVFSTLGTAAVAASDAGHHAASAMTLTPAAHAHVNTPLMLLSHAAAGLLTLALLRGAERAAWRLLTEFARLVVSSFRAPTALPVTVPPARAPLSSPHPARLASRLLISAASRRGPPLSVAF